MSSKHPGRPKIHFTNLARIQSLKAIQLRAYLKKHNKTMDEYTSWKELKKREKEINSLKRVVKNICLNYTIEQLQNINSKISEEIAAV